MKLAKLDRIPQKVGAKVVGSDCRRSAATWVHFVDGMEGWALCNGTGHCVISIFLNYRLLTLRAGAEGVNVFLQVSPGDWFTCEGACSSFPYPGTQPSSHHQATSLGRAKGEAVSTKKLHQPKTVAFPKLCETFQRVPELWRCSQSTLRLRWGMFPSKMRFLLLGLCKRIRGQPRLPAAQLTSPVSGGDPERGRQTATVAQLFQLSRIDLTSN